MVGKKYKVVLTRNSSKSLKRIYNYYKDQGEADLGKEVKDELLKASDLLQDLPNSKPKLPSEKQTVPSMRYSKKLSYKIIFQVFEPQDTVVVLDFIHDREDPRKWEKL
jgi:plasmid stabilization system protein ParE